MAARQFDSIVALLFKGRLLLCSLSFYNLRYCFYTITFLTAVAVSAEDVYADLGLRPYYTNLRHTVKCATHTTHSNCR